MRRQIARWMRRATDRIDRHGAPKVIGWSFTFESGEGIRFREDGKGVRLAYLGDDDYHKAHDEADKPTPRIDWAALTDVATALADPARVSYLEDRRGSA